MFIEGFGGGRGRKMSVDGGFVVVRKGGIGSSFVAVFAIESEDDTIEYDVWSSGSTGKLRHVSHKKCEIGQA